MARKKVADEKELTRILSAIARGDMENEECVKVAERLKAVELLGKKYSFFGTGGTPDNEVRVVVDYIGQGNGSV